MNNKNTMLKLIFGLMILAFSLALAYFIAAYVDDNKIFDFWGTLLIIAVVYAIVGLLVINIIPISLGFFFSADWLIINLLFNNLGDWPDYVKTLVVCGALIVLYFIALLKLSDDEDDALYKESAADEEEEEEETKEEAGDIFADNEDLNSILKKIDVSGVEKVIFYPQGNEPFSTTEEAIIKIAVFTEQKFGKSEFAPGELSDYYDEFYSAYKPTLSADKVKVVLDKFSEFVKSGGNFKLV